MATDIRIIRGLGVLLLITLSAAAIAQTSPPPTGKVSSEFGIPGEVPVDEVWRHLLAESDLTRTGAALKVTNELFNDQGELDIAACRSHVQAVRDALAVIPVSAGLWLYGGRCAELAGDSVLAAQSEPVLAALIGDALANREIARFARPIRVLGENDISAILELTGERVLYQFYEVPITDRHMRLIATLYDEDTHHESTLYFDFLDNYVRVARSKPELAYPDGRRLFAQSVLKVMQGSASADLAREILDAISKPTKVERIDALLKLGKADGDYGLWLGLMCSAVPKMGCATEGVELLLPYAEAKFADAYVALALAYATGNGVERDDDAARDMLRAANEALGAPRAELNLQFMLQTLSGETKLHPLVADTLRAAADSGDPGANLLVALDQGDWSGGGVPDVAIPMLERASQGGIARATALIGRHHLIAGQVEVGLKLLAQAADAGDSSAASVLGGAYALRGLVKRDTKLSLRWLTEAAQDGDLKAISLLAVEYQRLGGADNMQRADRWLSNGLLLGDQGAALQLAQMLSGEPEGVSDPAKRAMLIFNALIEEHDSNAARVALANWYLTGKGEHHQPEKAEPLLRAAAEHGDDEAQLDYVVRSLMGELPAGDKEKARAWLEQGLTGKNPTLAVGYASTLLRVPPPDRDAKRALAVLTRWWETEHHSGALNDLAWARCTSTDDSVFSVSESEKLGPALAAVAGYNLAWLDTVAACHAAAGQFERAAEVQQRVVDDVEVDLGADHPTARGMRARLERYLARQRFEETWPASED